MKRAALKMNIGNMVMWTERSKYAMNQVVDLAEKMTTDPDKKQRMICHECIPCYYGSRVGGSVMTTQPCMSCGKEEMYPSTNTDALCLDCARSHELCKHCGGDIKMRIRRKQWPSPVADV